MPASDRARAGHDTLTAQIEGLVSGDDWARFLAVVARFHKYSTGTRRIGSARIGSGIRSYHGAVAMGRRLASEVDW